MGPRLAVTAATIAAAWVAWDSARERMQAEATATSLAAAERALVRAPIEARSASALGQARFAAGDGAGAAAAFRVAGALGWRDRPAQVYLYAAALQSGDAATAAARLDAVLRQEPHLPQRSALLAPLEATPAGRRALAGRLAERPVWSGTYFASLDGVGADQLRNRALVLGEPRLANAAPGCDRLGEFIGALRASRQTALAGRVVRERCGGGVAGALIDGGFERARLSSATPSGWQFAGAGGLDVRLAPAEGFAGQAVTVSSALPTRQVFATQALEIGPGRWTIAWRARGAVSRVLARLACRRGEGAATARARAAAGDRFTMVAELPSGCAAPSLELAVAPGSGTVTVDDVAIGPAR